MSKLIVGMCGIIFFVNLGGYDGSCKKIIEHRVRLKRHYTQETHQLLSLKTFFHLKCLFKNKMHAFLKSPRVQYATGTFVCLGSGWYFFCKGMEQKACCFLDIPGAACLDEMPPNDPTTHQVIEKKPLDENQNGDAVVIGPKILVDIPVHLDHVSDSSHDCMVETQYVKKNS